MYRPQLERERVFSENHRKAIEANTTQRLQHQISEYREKMSMLISSMAILIAEGEVQKLSLNPSIVQELLDPSDDPSLTLPEQQNLRNRKVAIRDALLAKNNLSLDEVRAMVQTNEDTLVA